MRYVSVIVSVIVVLLVGSGGQLSPLPGALAQEDGQCIQLAAQAVSDTGAACADLESGQACYGHGTITAAGPGGAATAWAASGDTLSLSGIELLATAAANPDTGEWGMVSLVLPAALPESGTQPVRAVLFGQAQVARPAQVASDRPTLPVTNSGGAEINLRNGAGVTYEVVGQMQPGETALADGRNEQGDWARIQKPDGDMAWVFVRLIDWEGDFDTLMSLETLLPGDITPVLAPGGDPFQSFTLVTGAENGCIAAPSGLLLQFSGDAPAALVVNQVSLEFASATLFLRAGANDSLEVMVLAGSGVVTARGIPKDAPEGGMVQVSLGGEDGLTPTAPPTTQPAYPFPAVAHVPAGLLPGAMTCMVGLPTPDADVRLRVGPGEGRGELAQMSANRGYRVLGWTNDPDGAPWWELDTGEQTSWVAQAAVRPLGACDVVAEVEAPPLVIAPVGPPAGGEGGGVDSGEPDLSPAVNSVWQMVPGSDNLTGECSGEPAINFCDHLAAISPATGGIMWKGMEASPYYLARIQPNVYAYSGPNVLGTGTINMTLTFSSETALNMTMSLVLASEPNCQHIYYYTGTKNW